MLKRALAGALALLCAACSPAFAAEPVDTAIVFLVDVSHSMDDDEIGIAREAHVLALASSDVLTAVQSGPSGRIAVAYVEFAGDPETVVPWMTIAGPDDALGFAEVVNAAPILSRSYTGIGGAFLAAAVLVDQLPWPAERIVVDIVGDGINNIPPSLDSGRSHLLERGVVINGMPLMLEPSTADLDGYYGRRVIGPGGFILPLKSIDQMPSAMRQKIVQELF